MSEDPSKKRLGRGLAALIGDIDLTPLTGTNEKVSTSERQIPVEFIERNPRNPRRIFTEAELADLAESIRVHGVVQPVVVRPLAHDPQRYQLIAGERRWRAAQRAGLKQMPAIIRDVDDQTALQLAIIENIQRADLNPIEEATGYQQLVDEHGYTQADLAHAVGKSRSHVANTLRLLNLPEKIRQYLAEGTLSAGHARCLITADDPLALAEKIIRDGLSVRQAEVLAQSGLEKTAKRSVKAEKDADTRSLEKLLADMIGMKVAIRHAKNGGDLTIHYSSLDQLDDICRRLQS